VRYLVIDYENASSTGGAAMGEEGTEGQSVDIAILSTDCP